MHTHEHSFFSRWPIYNNAKIFLPFSPYCILSLSISASSYKLGLTIQPSLRIYRRYYNIVWDYSILRNENLKAIFHFKVFLTLFLRIKNLHAVPVFCEPQERGQGVRAHICLQMTRPELDSQTTSASNSVNHSHISWGPSTEKKPENTISIHINLSCWWSSTTLELRQIKAKWFAKVHSASGQCVKWAWVPGKSWGFWKHMQSSLATRKLFWARETVSSPLRSVPVCLRQIDWEELLQARLSPPLNRVGWLSGKENKWGVSGSALRKSWNLISSQSVSFWKWLLRLALLSFIKSGSVRHSSESVPAHFAKFQTGLNQSFYFRKHAVETGIQSFRRWNQNLRQERIPFLYSLLAWLSSMLFLPGQEPQNHGKGKVVSFKDAVLIVTSDLATISSATWAAVSRKQQQTEGRLEGVEKKVDREWKRQRRNVIANVESRTQENLQMFMLENEMEIRVSTFWGSEPSLWRARKKEEATRMRMVVREPGQCCCPRSGPFQHELSRGVVPLRDPGILGISPEQRLAKSVFEITQCINQGSLQSQNL